MLAPSSLHVCLGRQASPFLVTAGMDRQIRYWDLRKPAASFCASGYAMETGPTSTLGRPSFVAQQIMPAANMTMPADGIGGGGGLIKGSGIPCQVFLCQDPAMPGTLHRPASPTISLIIALFRNLALLCIGCRHGGRRPERARRPALLQPQRLHPGPPDPQRAV
jgi:hypothetical protein